MLQGLQIIRKKFAKITAEQWSHDSVQQAFSQLKSFFEKKSDDPSWDDVSKARFSRLFPTYLRWALTGGRPGPNLSITMACLGRKNTLARLDSAENESMVVQPYEDK